MENDTSLHTHVLWLVQFNEMEKYIERISYKTLSAILKELEADRLGYREEHPHILPKVEYRLMEWPGR